LRELESYAKHVTMVSLNIGALKLFKVKQVPLFKLIEKSRVTQEFD